MAVGLMAVAMAMLTNNCTNLTNGISTDPVNITDPTVIAASKYMSGVQVSLIGVFEGEIARGTGMWAGYFDGEDRQYTGLAGYVTSGQDYDNEWNTIYAGIFKDCQLLKHNATPTKNQVAIGIAQVMEGMALGLAADLWGDVPWTQATQFPVIMTPVFDKQAAVYASAHALLDSAININLIPSALGSGTGDFLLNGSKTAWIAAAHTIKARLYLHVRDYANAIIQANLGIASPAGNMMAPHGGVYLKTFNLYYSFLSYDRPGYMAGDYYAAPLLDPTSPTYRGNAKTNENGRLNYYYAPFAYWGGLNTGATYDPNVLVDFDWGTPTKDNGFFGASTAFPLVTWQENTLILAEAYMKQATQDQTSALAALNTLRAYNNTGAQYGTSTAYASPGALGGGFYLPYLITDFAPAGMANNGTDNQATALLREILEERYVTFIGQIEGWTDMRRTNNFLGIPLPAGKSDFPRRCLYSQGEVTTNPNVPTTGVGLFDPVTSFSTAY